MLLYKSVGKNDVGYFNDTTYLCDMCHRKVKSHNKYCLGTTKKGKYAYSKDYDLCERCLNTIKKNIENWYERLEKQSTKW